MKLLAWFEIGDASASRWQWVQRSWALFGLLLIAATWRLWIPQTVYPRVPLLRVAGWLPPAGQWLALAVLVGSLVLSLAISLGLFARLGSLPRRGPLPRRGSLPRRGGASKTWLFLAFVAAMACLVLADQHRLQPWAYQLTICAMVFALAPSDSSHRAGGLALLRILTVSIYLFSALGKFDYQFLHTVGQEFLAAAAGLVGIEVATWSLTTRLALAAAFPLVELLVVIGLAAPRLRRIGVPLAVALHVSLLLVLGPWGLGHQPGVLVWNLFFIAQAGLLFAGSPRHDVAAPDAAKTVEPPRQSRAAACVVLAAVCLPLFEPLGWFDHWPSWGLYSPRNSRAIVQVHRAGLKKLPAELQPFLETADAEASWVTLDIDGWSLAALSVPIYPQNRFQLGVAESIAERYGLDREIRVHLLGISNRLSGARQATTLTGRQRIVAAGREFRLNAHPAEVP